MVHRPHPRSMQCRRIFELAEFREAVCAVGLARLHQECSVFGTPVGGSTLYKSRLRAGDSKSPPPGLK